MSILWGIKIYKYCVKLINDDKNQENELEFTSMADVSKYLQNRRDEKISKLFINQEEVL
jgi:hypothetical protein